MCDIWRVWCESLGNDTVTYACVPVGYPQRDNICAQFDLDFDRFSVTQKWN